MKLNKHYYLAIFAIVAIIAFTVFQKHTNAQFGSKAIELSLKAEKDKYTLGDVVELNIQLSNMTDSAIEIITPDVRSGILKVYLSDDGQNFREYNGPGWGSFDGRKPATKLASGEGVNTKAEVLHNKVVSTGHLTPMYADRIRDRTMDSPIAFTKPGRYWLKAAITYGKTEIESVPLAIDISAPEGRDAIVWEKMKDNSEYAYFLQTGDFASLPETLERETFVASLRQIVSELDGSKYGMSIRDKLVKYDAMKENLRQVQASVADQTQN